MMLFYYVMDTISKLKFHYCCSVTQLCPTLYDQPQCSPAPWKTACQASLSSTISQSCSNSYPRSQSSNHPVNHWMALDDAIQSSPLLPPSCRPLILSQHQGFFQLVRSSHQIDKVLELCLFIYLK